MGNLRSVQKALEKTGADVKIIQTPAELAGAEKIVLPGVGACRDAIDRIRSHGFAEPLADAIRSGTPFLGICLGMQMLFDVSYENGEYAGLGILPGKVVRFDFSQIPGVNLRIPQMGWNQIRWNKPIPLLNGVENGAYVYFANSYYCAPEDAEVTATTTDYGYPFTSSVWKDNLFATQFHPEKSQAVGAKILENFVKL